MKKLLSYFSKIEIILWCSSIAMIFVSFAAFVLEHFETQNIVPSTISVTTSFLAVYLTFRRSPYFALAYAANDIVLIFLWILASVFAALREVALLIYT